MKPLEKNSFYAGCNYWASKSGIYMWRQWDAKNVEEDLGLISALGIRLIRVFPLWQDFQPIQKIHAFHQKCEGLSIDDGRNMLSDFDDGMDERMMERFESLLDLAKKYDLQVIPSLLTGWMSGRLFVPPALEGIPLLTDPFAMRWEVRFLKSFVSRMRHHRAIAAWCIGNECNCMGEVENRDQAWLWVNTMSDAIRTMDPDRPILAGMHGLGTAGEKKGGNQNWVIQDCALSCDFLTTHPYASPTYKMDHMKINTLLPMLHPAAQTLYYAGIGNKPCLIEETGTFGQMYANDDLTAQYAKGVLYTAWAHQCLAYLWWIGFDQGSLHYHPFSYNNRASNYGLYREDKTIKPVGKVLKEFHQFLKDFPYPHLPDRITDAVCLLTPGQNTWEVAGACFALAKQANIDIQYAWMANGLPDADAYFLPSLHSSQPMSADQLQGLMNRVKDGAVLYLSVDGGFIRNMNSEFGFKIQYRESVAGERMVSLGDDTLPVYFNVRYEITPTTATILAKDAAGKPVFLRAPYGKGTVFFLMAPLEASLYGREQAFQRPYYKFYREIKKYLKTDKIMDCDHPLIGMTEHIISDQEHICVFTAYADTPQKTVLAIPEGWKADGDPSLALDGSETRVMIVKKIHE